MPGKGLDERTPPILLFREVNNGVAFGLRSSRTTVVIEPHLDALKAMSSSVGEDIKLEL